jgi:hypothetical protein
VYLFETGPFQRIPGFDEGFSFALLPFWGDFCLVDFMLANFSAADGVEISIVLDERSRSASLSMGSRWKKAPARLVELGGSVPELARLLSASSAEHAVLAALSSIAVLDRAALRALISAAGDQLVKLSVGRTPVEIYCARREHLLKLVTASLARATSLPRFRDQLFSGILHPAMDLIEDVPGELLFQNSLMELYQSNLWAVSNCESGRYHGILAGLPAIADRGGESHVAEKATIRNSLIASGVEVQGIVEDSIVFPNVVIGRNAHVARSVVLSGNRIGASSEICNALLLPFTAEVPRSSPNIGERCVIGALRSTAKNVDFPDQIRDGLTVIGTNADIPNGFHMEAGSFVAPGVALGALRKMKHLRRGTSVLGGVPESASDGSPEEER